MHDGICPARHRTYKSECRMVLGPHADRAEYTTESPLPAARPACTLAGIERDDRHQRQCCVSLRRSFDCKSLGTSMALIQLPRPGSITLRRLADELRREFAAANRIDGKLVDRDVAARRHEAAGGRLWAKQRERIQGQLEKLGITEDEWCKRELDCDIRTMRRRVRLARGWVQYETARRDAGSNGQYGLVYGLSLISSEPTASATNGHRLSIRSGTDTGATGLDMSRCQVYHGRRT